MNFESRTAWEGLAYGIELLTGVTSSIVQPQRMMHTFAGMSLPPLSLGDLRAWIDRIGVFGLFVFAFFAFWGTTFAYYGLGLMGLGVLAQWRCFWKALKPGPLLALLGWTGVAVVITVSLAIMERPDESSAQIRAGSDMFRLWLFLLVAWWLRGSQHRIFLALVLGLVGFMIGQARALDPPHLHALLSLERPNIRWGINAVAEYSAAGLLGLGLSAPRLWRWLRAERGWWVGGLGLAAFVFLLLAEVIFSQSRGVWLSLLGVAVGLWLYALVMWPTQRPRGASMMLGAAIGLLIAVLIVLGLPAVSQRFAFIDQALLASQGSWDDVRSIADFSIRERLAILKLGIESWLEKPWFGWGLGAIPPLLQRNADKFESGANFPDFHNICVDVLVGLGAFGTVPLVLIFLLVTYAVHQAHCSGRIDRDTCLVVLGLMVFNILAQLTDTRIFSLHGRFYWMLIAGAAYSCRLAQATEMNTETKISPGCAGKRLDAKDCSAHLRG